MKTVIATTAAPGAIGPYSQAIEANAGAGCTLGDVVKTTVFLTDMGAFAAVNAVYAKYFEGDCPARSAVQVGALPKGALVEIEAIAVKK